MITCGPARLCIFWEFAARSFVIARNYKFHLTLKRINRSLSATYTFLTYERGSRRWKVSQSAVRAFTDPDVYFAGIRNLPIDGLVTERGKFRAEATFVDLHRLQMGRFDEDLPRIMRITPSGSRCLILFQTDPSRPAMMANAIDISQNQIAMFGLEWPYYLRSSAGGGWGTMSLMPEDLAAAGTAIIGRELMPPRLMLAIERPPMLSLSRLLQLHRSDGPSREKCPGHPCQAPSSACD